VRKIAETSTHSTKTTERVVLGRWDPGGRYIAEAKSNGGVWYETDPSFYPKSKLSEGLDEAAARSKTWTVNEQFLESQLERGPTRIDLTGESIVEVLTNRPNSFTAMEINTWKSMPPRTATLEAETLGSRSTDHA